MRSLVGVFGDQNAAKLIDIVLAAVASLPETVHVALVGRRIDGYDLDVVVRGSGLGGRVHVRSDVSDADFLAWMGAADVVVDLRHPHRGEVSGSLARAMQMGRATLVSATGTYLDLPTEIVVRIPSGRLDPSTLAGEIRRLLEDEDRRSRIGRAARDHVAEQRRRGETANGYVRAIEDTLSLLADPTRRALARWGGALADLGVTEETLAEGYGLSYARALDDFATPVSHG
jgi:glycosyltransferase involved in cell wall biosynthesis